MPLKSIEQEKPDLLLLDVILPDMSGLEVCKRIKNDPRLSSIFVLLLSGMQTAYALEGAREKAIEAGCNDYISKPINKDELGAMINKYFPK